MKLHPSQRLFWLLVGLLMPAFSAHGLGTDIDNLCMTSNAQSRSVSPENFTGEKGKGGMATEGTRQAVARELGVGWKYSPSVDIKAGETFTLCDIKGPGAIQQIWMTVTGDWRHSIIRFYWDGEQEPSVESPVGDFFGCGWGKYCQISSLAVCVNPGSGFNSYWRMPFRKNARITLTNLDDKQMRVYYQVNYELAKVPRAAAYFHAQFRRESPLKTRGLYTILDGVTGRGQYVGTYMAWEARSPGWWGEGEIKFFLDGDKEFPTICGTGAEDYFCGSYDFADREKKVADRHYIPFTTAYAGLPQVLPPEVCYKAGQRFGLYRWHITDPVRFGKDLKVTIQALGWTADYKHYLQLEDDIASVAYWYQTEPHATFPALPARDALDIKPINVQQ
ncbi:MAG: glycoside hydrolase family 172 protein [Candidatus Sumerlaeia bacterium]